MPINAHAHFVKNWERFVSCACPPPSLCSSNYIHFAGQIPFTLQVKLHSLCRSNSIHFAGQIPYTCTCQRHIISFGTLYEISYERVVSNGRLQHHRPWSMQLIPVIMCIFQVFDEHWAHVILYPNPDSSRSKIVLVGLDVFRYWKTILTVRNVYYYNRMSYRIMDVDHRCSGCSEKRTYFPTLPVPRR